jgi:predicted phage gp36 major capsid-like protein
MRPSYSHELNPAKLANADIKQAVTKQAAALTQIQTQTQLVKAQSAICTAYRKSQNAFADTLNMLQFAMPPELSI